MSKKLKEELRAIERLWQTAERRANELNERLNAVILDKITTQNELGLLKIDFERKRKSEKGFIELAQRNADMVRVLQGELADLLAINMRLETKVKVLTRRYEAVTGRR